MDYEKKYKEALERARQFSEHPLQEDSSNIVEYIFPELQESENERTRKEIISFLQLPHKQFVSERKQEKWIAWLEKQGEQKPAWSEEDELHIRELESLVKKAWAIAEHENDKDTIHKMSDLSFFLKTLKPQLKREWSEEDEKMLHNIENCVHQCVIVIGMVDKVRYIDWLKSLKQRIGG